MEISIRVGLQRRTPAWCPHKQENNACKKKIMRLRNPIESTIRMRSSSVDMHNRFDDSSTYLLVLLSAQFGGRVGNIDLQLLGTADNGFPLAGTDTVADGGGILLVVHQQHLEVLHVVNNKMLLTIRVNMTELGGLLVPNADHSGHTWSYQYE